MTFRASFLLFAFLLGVCLATLFFLSPGTLVSAYHWVRVHTWEKPFECPQEMVCLPKPTTNN